MPVVIDGNNLLYAARAADTTALLLGRAMLCGAVGRWARQKNQQVTVIFDGPAPDGQRKAQVECPGVQTAYSGAGKSADAVVIQFIEAHSAPRSLLVVSTDREIVRAARRRRARPVRSEDFWERMQRDLVAGRPTVREPSEKQTGLDAEATRAWLKEFGLDTPSGEQRAG